MRARHKNEQGWERVDINFREVFAYFKKMNIRIAKRGFYQDQAQFGFEWFLRDHHGFLGTDGEYHEKPSTATTIYFNRNSALSDRSVRDVYEDVKDFYAIHEMRTAEEFGIALETLLSEDEEFNKIAKEQEEYDRKRKEQEESSTFSGKK